MKKLFFTSVFLTIGLVSTATFAQEEIAKSSKTQENNIEAVNLHELPEAIIAVVTSNFTEHTPASAFKKIENNREIYIVTYTKNNIEESVLFDAEGTIILQNISGI